jgi:hypothetical protein
VRLEAELRRVGGAAISRGSPFDRWDIEVRTGPLGAARLRLGVEEHGDGKQLLRFRVWPQLSRGAIGTVAVLLLLLATRQEGVGAELIVGACAALTAIWMIRDCAAAVAVLARALAQEQQAEADEQELAVALTFRARSTGDHSAAGVGAFDGVRSYAVHMTDVED